MSEKQERRLRRAAKDRRDLGSLSEVEKEIYAGRTPPVVDSWARQMYAAAPPVQGAPRFDEVGPYFQAAYRLEALRAIKESHAAA